MRSIHIGNPDCKKSLALLDAYLSNELIAESAVQINSHLEKCAECSGEFCVREHLKRRLQMAISRNPTPTGLERTIFRILRRNSGFGIFRPF
jgi:predicted anti-sigma-YlaC factor YlaD